MLYPRPESPPPRAPSPPLYAFTPLPSPSSRTNRKPSSSSSSAPSLPPGLQQDRTLLTVRSYEQLSPRKSEFHRQPKRIRSALGHTSSGARTQSLPEPFTRPVASRPHQRTTSLTPRSSPPPSPKLQTPPPPVPRIPSFVLTPADKKSASSADSLSGTTIYIPDIESVSPIAELPASILKSSKKAGLGRTKAAGMTCLKFFTLRNSLKSNRL
ncbi:hypothetical protein D9756_000485 [Leucocoprinus leucothites]|uniref:Uncharacterized protein n=1 Tax=Leucocoprinus leucothites TaxID=201217 RepID=A0A8H5GFT9_9AGAR|nr:hypothetical protein D9756_000485 [Leucoagaricus leucothites]